MIKRTFATKVEHNINPRLRIMEWNKRRCPLAQVQKLWLPLLKQFQNYNTVYRKVCVCHLGK